MNLINFELQQRGLEINDKEMQYIFTYHSRDLNSLLNLAEKLDEISSQEKSISIINKENCFKNYLNSGQTKQIKFVSIFLTDSL